MPISESNFCWLYGNYCTAVSHCKPGEIIRLNSMGSGMCSVLAPPFNCQRLFSVCDSQSLQEGNLFISSRLTSSPTNNISVHLSSPHLTSLHITSACFILLYVSSFHFVSVHVTSSISSIFISSHFISPHLPSPLLTPHLSSYDSYVISPHLTSSQLIPTHLSSIHLILVDHSSSQPISPHFTLYRLI